MVGGSHSVLIYNATSASVEKVGEYSTGGEVASLATSPDGSRTVVGTEDRKVTLLDETGTAIWSNPVGDWATQVALSEDGSVIAAGSMDKKLQVFFQNGTLRWGYDLPAWPTALAVSGDGTYIGVGCEDGTSFLFSTALTPNRTVAVRNTTPAQNGTVAVRNTTQTKNRTANTTAAALTAVPVPTKSPMPAFPAVLAVLGFVALASRHRF